MTVASVIIMGMKARWSKEEVFLLELNYPSKGAIYCAKLLNKTEQAVRQKAYRLCLKCQVPNRYSRLAIEWLRKFENPNILHAENGGEQMLLGYRVDGYDPNENIVYEFHGDKFHGNLDIFQPDETPNPYSPKATAESLWQNTFDRMNDLSKVAKVIYVWENDYNRGKLGEEF